MSDHAWLQLRSKTAEGATGVSPDIILGGLKADPAWVADDDKIFNQSSNYSSAGYVWVRAKNGGTTLAIGSASVWVARLTDLTTQANWVQLYTADGRNSATIGAQADEVASTGAPLIWHPSGPPAPGTPYCLIAELTGDGFPTESLPATVQTQADFDAFVASSGRMAYLTVQDAPVVTTPKPVFSWSLPIAINNADQLRLGLSLTCTTGPAGGTVTYALDKPDSSGSPIGVGKTPYTIGTSYSQNRVVNAEFASTVVVNFEPPSTADTHAEFTFQVTTLAAGSGGGHHIEHPKLVSEVSIVFGQTTIS